MENKASVRRGDVVMDGDYSGLVLEADINMWGEEVVPAGVRVLWADGDISVVYEDEIEVVTTCK